MGFFQQAGKIVTYSYSAIGQQPYHHQLARTPQAEFVIPRLMNSLSSK